MSLLGITNYIIQVFFIRLTKHQIKQYNRFRMHSYSPGGGISGEGDYEIHQWYSLQYWVIPFTGWTSDFRYASKGPKFFRITKDRIIDAS